MSCFLETTSAKQILIWLISWANISLEK